MEASEKVSFCNLLRDVRDEKEKTKTVVPK